MMTRLTEPYRVEHTIRVTHVAQSVVFPQAQVLSGKGPNYFARGVPHILTAMLRAHGAIDVKIRRFENTNHIERILSIKKAR